MGSVYLKSFILFVFAFVLTCNTAPAQIKYSFGPVCESEKVVCPDPNEAPVCFSTKTRINIEKFDFYGININRFQPMCNGIHENFFPTCVDLENKAQAAPGHIVLGCVEFPKCSIENDNNANAFCSDGKIAKCLGGDSKPNCSSKTLCENGIAVCDYTWQALAH